MFMFVILKREREGKSHKKSGPQSPRATHSILSFCCNNLNVGSSIPCQNDCVQQ